MHPVDLAIIVVYLLLMAFVGWWVSKRASRSVESYFLAGRSLPWWVIGVAHGSSGVDITGTMWFVMMLYIYGVKATWLLWVWPLFNVIFRMMYLGTWVRRSNVLTGAEWMRTRFGNSRGAELAYVSVVIYALVSLIGFLSYAFRGVAAFTGPLFPWRFPDEVYGTAVLVVTGVYCVVGGMYSVVMNDLIQFVLKVIAAVAIAVIAIVLIQPEQIMAAVPAGWDKLFFGWKLDLDWSGLMPALNQRIYAPYDPAGSGGDGYSLFMLFTGMLLLKGVLVSMAGPTPNYAIQHILSTRSPREAALENMVMAVVSLAPRFLLIAAIAVLGIVFYSPDLAKMGVQGQLREDPAGGASRLRARGIQGNPHCGPDRVVYEHVCLYSELRRGLRRQRRLQALHQSPCPAEAIRGGRLDHFGGRDPVGHRVRVSDQECPRRDRLDCVGAGASLCRAERAQVALVAFQRLRFPGRHGRRDRGCDPEDFHPYARRAGISADPGDQLRCLRGRLPADEARGRRGADEFLPPRATVGMLGSDLREVSPPRTRASRRTRTLGAIC